MNLTHFEKLFFKQHDILDRRYKRLSKAYCSWMLELLASVSASIAGSVGIVMRPSPWWYFMFGSALLIFAQVHFITIKSYNKECRRFRRSIARCDALLKKARESRSWWK
jgi:hypothetical protein